MILSELDPGTRSILEGHGFDAPQFELLRAALVEGTLTPGRNVVAGTVAPVLPSDLTTLPAPGQPGYEEAIAAGLEALREGSIAIVVLAGGMATRFGGGVKAVTEAIDGKSFLEVKLEETQRLAAALDTAIPAALMTSFATDGAVAAHVAERGLGTPRRFRQSAAPRLRPDGSVFLDADLRPSLYGQGHGDLFSAIRESGTLDDLVRDGVRSVVVSNVDNLAARVDPAIVGMHVLAGTPLTVEVVAKGSDSGGAPARVDGRPRLLETMQFPPDFDQDLIPVFNTNTSLITVEALADPGELTWLVVEKRVDGEAVVQFERLYHELSAHVETTFLVVPRDGPRGRFLPVKEPEDLLTWRRSCERCSRPTAAAGSRRRLGTKCAAFCDPEGLYGQGMQIVDLLLPRRCGICGKVGESACATCLARLVRCLPPWCERCGAPGPWPVRRCAECTGRRLAFTSARAALVYEAGAQGVRRLVEGTWAPRPDRRGGPARHRGAAAAGCAGDRIRSRRSRPWARTRSCAGSCAGGTALRRVVAPVAHGPAATLGGRASAQPSAGRAAPERGPGLHRAWTGAVRSLPRRRRLHDGVDRSRVRRCPSQGGRAARRGALPGQGGAVVQ